MMNKLFPIILAAVLFTSCLSLEDGHEFDYVQYLPQDSAGYAYMGGEANRALIEEFVHYIGDGSRFLTRFISGRTEHVLAAFNHRNGSNLSLQILVLGNFNSSQINTALISQKKNGWVQKDRKTGWWFSGFEGIHVASPMRHILYVSTDPDDDLLEHFANPVIHSNLNRILEMQGEDISMLISDLSIISEKATSNGSFRMPVNELLLHATSNELDYSFFGTIGFESVADARKTRPILLTMLNMQLYQMGITDSLFNRDLKLIPEAERLKISGLKIKKSQILPLFEKLVLQKGNVE